VESRQESAACCRKGKLRRRQKIDKVLQPARRTDLKESAQQAAQIVGRCGEEIPLAELVDPLQPSAPGPAGLTDMSEGPFYPLDAKPLQLPAALAAH